MTDHSQKSEARLEFAQDAGTETREDAPVAQNSKAPSQPFRMRTVLLWGTGLGLMLAMVIMLAAPALREWGFAILPETDYSKKIHAASLRELEKEVRKAERNLAGLRKRFQGLAPRVPYLIVDSSENFIYVMSGDKLIHKGKCSTGSYVLLKASDNRQWMFATPRGMFRVIGKVEAPVWRMPDWAFVEEGRPIPPPDSPERFEYGVLGDYALAFGNGYLVHGTLYKRMLGMPVTHGCVRLDDEELRIVYQNLHVGSKIFIY